MECTEAPWTEIPLHHPFTDLASLERVQESLQVCVLGIVTHQPGLVHRETTWGAADVCNAVLRQGSTEIRCGFWRRHGEELAEYMVGEAVALMQVTVKRKGDSWELFANESTVVKRCPEDLTEALRDSTDISDGAAAPTSLTQRNVVDYDTVNVKKCTVSGLASVPQQRMIRELPGIFEIHCVAVMGVKGIASDGALHDGCGSAGCTGGTLTGGSGSAGCTGGTLTGCTGVEQPLRCQC